MLNYVQVSRRDTAKIVHINKLMHMKWTNHIEITINYMFQNLCLIMSFQVTRRHTARIVHIDKLMNMKWTNHIEITINYMFQNLCQFSGGSKNQKAQYDINI